MIAHAMPTPDRASKRLRWLALLFALLGGLGLAGHLASYPYRATVPISELARDADGFLAGDFERPWPFKINKDALDQIAVVLPDGTALDRVTSRAALAVVTSGFLVNRPEIVFRLAGVTPRQGETITVVLPVKTRDILYQLPLGIAAVLLLASWPGLRSRATIRALWWRPLALAVASLGIALVGLLGLYVARGPAVWLAILVLFIGPLIAAAILLGPKPEQRGETLGVGRRSSAPRCCWASCSAPAPWRKPISAGKAPIAATRGRSPRRRMKVGSSCLRTWSVWPMRGPAF